MLQTSGLKVQQRQPNTFTAEIPTNDGPGRLSFFGTIDFGQKRNLEAAVQMVQDVPTFGKTKVPIGWLREAGTPIFRERRRGGVLAQRSRRSAS